ncbi:MAG: protein kinase, partial [Planctomycetota bacterium]|nr:protein kinase [Planctomycetota bacterium]
MSFDEEKLRLMWEKTIIEGSLANKDPGLTYGRHDPLPNADLNPALFPTLLVNPLEAPGKSTEDTAPELAPTMLIGQADTIVTPPLEGEVPAPPIGQADTIVTPPPGAELPAPPIGQADTIVAPPPEGEVPVPPKGLADTIVATPPPGSLPSNKNKKPASFQNYDLKKEIGRGGMGVVYAALQGGLDRLVAVKKNLDNQLEARSRFISEAIVTGQLDHPNIVPVYDMGFSAEGEVLLSMKLVGGQPWSDWLKDKFNEDNRLSEDNLLEAFEILIKVCDAISFSHEKLIVHNDLKPENIMVGKHGEVFVMDWGLAVDVSQRDEAQLTQSQRQTLHKSTMRSPCGTPAYMAPELANGDGDQICPQTDVYLLGAILYEFVTGRRRHRGKTLLIVLRSAILSEEPDFTDHGDIESEIQDICRKAMKLNPEDRYSSAKEFQIAIKNHLQHRESLKIAHVANTTLAECEKARLKLISEETQTLNESERNRLYGQYAEVVAGFRQALILWSDNKEAKKGTLNASVAYAKIALSQNDLGLAEAQLAALPPGLNVTLELSREINAAKQIVINKEQQQKRVRWALAGTILTIFIGLAVGLFFINKEKTRATENAATARSAAERAEANAREAKRQAKIAKQQSAEALRQRRVAFAQQKEAQKQKRDADEQRQIAQTQSVMAQKLRAVAIETAKRAEVEAARAQSLRNEAEYQTALARYELALGTVREGDGYVLAGRWRLARLSYSNARKMFSEIKQPTLPADLGLWSSDRVQSPIIIQSQNSRNAITAMVSHPTRDWVFTGHGTGTIKVWDLFSGRVLYSWIGHNKDVRSLAISPDGRYLLSGSGASKRNILLWAILAKRPYSIDIRGQNCPVNAVAFNRKGTHFYTAGSDSKLRYWSLASRQLVSAIDIGNGSSQESFGRTGILSLAVSPGNQFIATGSASGAVMILDLKAQTRRFIRHRLPVNSVQFSPYGDFVISASNDGTVKLTDTLSGVVKNTLVGHRSFVMKAVSSPDGSKILSASQDRTARIWDAKSGKTLRTLGPLPQAVHNVAFSNDGRFAMAAGYRSGDIKIWSLEENPGLTQFQATSALNSAIATSKDGLYVASATRDRSFVLWDSKTGYPLKSFTARDQVQSLRFTSNGRQ